MTLGFVVVAPADMVAVLCNVGQVAEIAEGPNHHHGLVAAEVGQQPVEHPSSRGVLLQTKPHRQLPHPLHQFIGIDTFVFSNDIAQEAAEQAYVPHQGLVLVKGRC